MECAIKMFRLNCMKMYVYDFSIHSSHNIFTVEGSLQVFGLDCREEWKELSIYLSLFLSVLTANMTKWWAFIITCRWFSVLILTPFTSMIRSPSCRPAVWAGLEWSTFPTYWQLDLDFSEWRLNPYPSKSGHLIRWHNRGAGAPSGNSILNTFKIQRCINSRSNDDGNWWLLWDPPQTHCR